MKKACIYGCALLLLSCGGKTGGGATSKSSSVEQTAEEKVIEKVSSLLSEPLSVQVYEDDDWIVPDTLSAALQKEPEASAVQDYVPDSICRKQTDGAERCYYEGKLMNGAYRHFFSRPTDSFMPEMYYSVAVYKDGIKNDTVRHYSLSLHCMTARLITLDSIRELYQSYHSNGHPYIFYQSTRGKLDGVRQRWSFDGKPDWFEHYKDGKPHGKEMRWYASGHLSEVNHYMDGEESFPRERWYYTRAKNDYNYANYAEEAPDGYAFTYRASEGEPFYCIEERYALEPGRKKYMVERKYFKDGDEQPLIFVGDQCDSVRRDVVTIGSQKRLEIRNYSAGRLWRIENYPYSEGGRPGVMIETYSEEGNLVEKGKYDYNSGKMIFLRVYATKGADIRQLAFEDYMQVKADSCNKRLESGKGRYTNGKDKLSIRWKKGELELLNSPWKDGSEGYEYREWYYDGYHPEYGLHFFHFVGFESWGYFAMNDTTGAVYELRAIDTPLFCAKSGFFLTVDENPYEGGCYVRVYKMLPGRRLAEVAVLERGGFYYSQVDLEDFLWVSESSFVANKKVSDAELQYDFYGGCPDSCLAEYRKHGYLQDDEIEWGYVRVDLHPDALQTAEELPSSLETIREMNTWIESLRNPD